MNRRSQRLAKRHTPQRRDRRRSSGALTPFAGSEDWQRFEENLTQLERAVQQLRQRFETVRSLQAEQRQIEQQLQQPDLHPEEIAQLQQRLHTLEGALDEHLFDWRSLQEPFWQAVRFGGLGIVIGWILHAIANR